MKTAAKQIAYTIRALAENCAREITTPAEAVAFMDAHAKVQPQRFRISDRWHRLYEVSYDGETPEFSRIA